MTVALDLPPEMEKRIRERAAAKGQDVADFIREVLGKEVGIETNGPALAHGADRAAAPQVEGTFDEILAPVREGFAKSGLTEEELEQLFEQAREEVWQEKQQPKGRS